VTRAVRPEKSIVFIRYPEGSVTNSLFGDSGNPGASPAYIDVISIRNHSGEAP